MLIMHLAATSGKPPSEIAATWDLEELHELRVYNLIEPITGWRNDLLLTRIYAALVGGASSDLLPEWGKWLWDCLPIDPKEAIRQVQALMGVAGARAEARATGKREITKGERFG